MKNMTSLERCQAVLSGILSDYLPIIPQSFMYAVETAGLKISDVNHSGKRMAECHLISQEKYGYDGCVIDFDDASIAEAVRLVVQKTQGRNSMPPFVMYDVPQSVWHNIAMGPDTLLLIVERDGTHLNDVAYRPFSAKECNEVKQLIERTKT